MEHRELMRMAVFLLEDAAARIVTLAQAMESAPVREHLCSLAAVLAENARAIEGAAE